MARYKPYDYTQTRLIPVCLEHPLLHGSLEHAIHMLVEHQMDLSMFDCRYNNDETGCKAYDPKILLKVVLFGYSWGFVGSRRIEWLCGHNVTCMALACMQCPDHSTIAAFVSCMHQEILSLFCDILLVCEQQHLLGGTVFALDGLKLASNASKQWSGTVEELKHKQEKLAEKIQPLLSEHQQVDAEAAAGVSAPEPPESGEGVSEVRGVETPSCQSSGGDGDRCANLTGDAQRSSAPQTGKAANDEAPGVSKVKRLRTRGRQA
jgi:transposase